MIFLKKYLYFNMLYKKIINNKLNEDIKMKIWNFYKKLIAYDIIKKFCINCLDECNDCFRINWYRKPYKNYLNSSDYNFMIVKCCSMSGGTSKCCIKKICSLVCRFKIKCYFCNHTFSHIPLQVQNLVRLKIHCHKCCKLNIIHLTWKHKLHDTSLLNNMIEPNYSKIIYEENNKYKYIIGNSI
jgi:hypothetical protein